MIAPNAPRPSRFDLGQLLATPGALQAMEAAGQNGRPFFLRHQQGDWGTICDDDKQANEEAILHGDRILSAYKLTTGVKIWLITEADRSTTTIMLPEEY